MNKEILVIGTGPAGLAIAGRLSQANIPFSIIDKSDNIANSWRNHYDRLHLHTVKELSSLPFLDFPEDYPTYVSKDQLVSYYMSYVQKFNIQPILKTTVKSITAHEGQWKVDMVDTSCTVKDAIICTGVNNEINMPVWENMGSFKGQFLHSRLYKNPTAYAGQKVLVIGMGNTGAEIALDLANAGILVDISVRGEVNIVPRDLNGQPVQRTSKKLAALPFGLGDWLGTQIRKIYFGDLSKYGLKTSKTPPAKQLLTTGKTPTIDIGTVAAIKKGKIKIKPDIKHFTSHGVVYEDGNTINYDSIICATGYKPGLEKFIPRINSYLDSNGCPMDCIGKDEFSGLYFVGFDNYKLGGILGTINTDSEKVVKALTNYEL